MNLLKRRALALWLPILLSLGCAQEATIEDSHAASPPAKYSDYAGVFTAGPLAVLETKAVDDWLALDPPSWTGRPFMVRLPEDEAANDAGEVFGLDLPYQAPKQTLTFFRDETGAVTEVEMERLDRTYDGQRFKRHVGDTLTPGLLFLAGKSVEAAQAALAEEGLTPDDLRSFGILQLLSHPTRSADTVAFLEVVSDAYPDHAGLVALYGYSLVSVGRRAEAPAILEASLQLDPQEQNALEALRRLTLREPAPGEGYRALLPFSIADAYAPPTEQEIAAVRADWASRDLSPRDVEVVHTFELTLEHGAFDGKIIRHSVHDDVHFGAVFVPKGAEGPLPVLLDPKGVDTAYSPRDISQGPRTLMATLGSLQTQVIVVTPAMRGNQLILNDQEFTATGDPSDAWDGATDDTLALLNAALDITPQADPNRVAIIGISRGGTVALLAGLRDSRISLALNIVGPVDHFKAMDRTDGWTKAEVVADTLSDGQAEPDEEGTQTYDHFFDRTDEPLHRVRHRLIASSPLYFLDSLPETHSYYGAEDRSVPIANPQMLRAGLESADRAAPRWTVTIFEDAGHDADSLRVRQDTVRRLVAWLEGS